MATKLEYRNTLYNETWIRSQYCDKARTASEIAVEVGCPTSTVLRALRSFGVQVRHETKPAELRKCPNSGDPLCKKEFLVGGRGNHSRSAIYCSRHCHMVLQAPRATASHAPRPRKNVDTLHNEQWLLDHYVGKKWTMGQISSVCNCTTQSVKWALEKFNIPVRSLSESMFGRTLGPGDRHTGNDVASKKRLKAYQQGQALKREMVAAYGGCCGCCKEKELAFLTLDHIGGGGAKDRAESGGSTGVYRRLKKAGWPKAGYRILCANCNIATKLGRTCPHQLNKEPNYVH